MCNRDILIAADVMLDHVQSCASYADRAIDAVLNRVQSCASCVDRAIDSILDHVQSYDAKNLPPDNQITRVGSPPPATLEELFDTGSRRRNANERSVHA